MLSQKTKIHTQIQMIGYIFSYTFIIDVHKLSHLCLLEVSGLFEQLYRDLGPLRHFGQLQGKDEQSVRIDGRLEDSGTLLLGRVDRTLTVFPLYVGT